MRARILNASAGSGKTYQLAYKYVRDVVEQPGIYRHILAVTFTNKATEEMKSRILKEIHLLASGQPSSYLDNLCRELSLDAATVRRRAREVRSKILHDYSRFTVLTIDTFFQRILRAFIKELGIDLNYNVEIETASVLTKSADTLIEQITTDRDLQRWLTDFVQERIDEGKKWDIRDGILTLGGELFKEKNKDALSAARPREELARIVGEATAHAAATKKRMQDAAAEAVRIIGDAGASVADFPYKGSGFAAYFYAVAGGSFERYGSRAEAACTRDEAWGKPGSTAQGLRSRLQPLLREMCGLYDENVRAWNTCDLLRENYRSFALLSDLYARVQQLCAEQSTMLLSETKYLLSEFIGRNDAPFIYEKVGNRYERFMIDEFQDIDQLQYELMEVLCGYHKNLFIVGDPDQTIYTWRGADVKYLLDFDKKFPGTKTILMMENYRSAPEILSAANSLIDKNRTRIKKELQPTLPSGSPVICHFAQTQEAEAEWIAGEMKELHEAGTPYRDMTVLYRAHYVTRAVEEVLLGEKIPYTIYSGVQFFDRMEIKDALSYLRMIAYKDDLSFRRIVNVPKRNLGKRRMAFLQEYAERQGRSLYQALQDNLEDPLFKGTGAGRFVGLIESFAAGYGGRPVSEVLSALLNESGYEKMLRTEGSQERLDNLAELKQSVYEYETTCGEEVTLEHYLAHVALFTNADTAEQGDKVRLMTVHAAKGLEFPYVFLCGMNEGIFPSRKVRTQQAMEEERRLAFVALTRAEKGLYISEADGRNFDGTPRYPSRFLLDIDRNLLAFTRPPEEGLIRAARDYIGHSQTYLPETDGNMAFSVGQRVKHILFGSGTVLDVDMDKGAHVVQFDEMETPRKISFRAKLERI